ncbi:MAG: hypothetical protein P4L22_01915 [Candidatus Babeliales bacterium]|nr:hypothetical protein [Candidatus Babeliales bacterium]
MKLFNLVLILFLLTLTSIKGSDISTASNMSDSSLLTEFSLNSLVLISNDEVKFHVSEEIAQLSGLLKFEMIKLNYLDNTIVVDINNQLLNQLLHGLKLIDKNKNKLCKCLLFELIQKEVFNKIPLNETDEIFKALDLLNCNLLTESFLDIYSQIFIEHQDKVLALFFGLTEIKFEYEKILHYLSIVGKFYYLRQGSMNNKLNFGTKDLTAQIHALISISKLEYALFDLSKFKTIYVFP